MLAQYVRHMYAQHIKYSRHVQQLLLHHMHHTVINTQSMTQKWKQSNTISCAIAQAQQKPWKQLLYACPAQRVLCNVIYLHMINAYA